MYHLKIFFIFLISFSTISYAKEWKGEWKTHFYRPIHYSQNNWNDFTAYHNLILSWTSKGKFIKNFQDPLQLTLNINYSHPFKRVPSARSYGWGPLQIGALYQWHPSYQIFARLITSYLKGFYNEPLLFGLEVGGRKTFVYKSLSFQWDHFISFNAPRYLLTSFLGSYFYNNLVSLGSSIEFYTASYKGFQLHFRGGLYSFYTYSKNIYYTQDSKWALSYSINKWSTFFSFIQSFNSREFLNMQRLATYDKAFYTGITFKFF